MLVCMRLESKYACLLLLALPAFGSVTTYTDPATWEQAVSAFSDVIVESSPITGGQLDSAVNVTTHSGMGTVSASGNGVFNRAEFLDCVGKDSCNGLVDDTTTFTFSSMVYGFAATWDLEGGTGSGLEIYINGPQYVSPNQGQDGYGAAYSGFFAVLSTDPFPSLLFASSVGEQAYTVEQMMLAIGPQTAVPEPRNLACSALACVILAFARARLGRAMHITRAGKPAEL